MRNFVTFPAALFSGINQALTVGTMKSAGSGLAAKAFGLVNQIISVTLISRTLGAQGLSDQLLAIAYVNWFGLTLCGMHASLPVLLIRAGTNANEFASVAKTAFILSTIGAVGSVTLTLLILKFDSSGDGAIAPVVTAALCNGVLVLFSLSEKIFQAIDRITEFNMLSIGGTLVSLTATIVLSYTYGTTSSFVGAYYVSAILPFLAAMLAIVPRLRPLVCLSFSEFRQRAQQLLGVGIFGFGHDIAAYCILQAPLALLSIFDLATAIPPVGLGLRLVGIISGGLNIIIPLLFLRVGEAIIVGDSRGRRQWICFGLVCATAVAVFTFTVVLSLGQAIYQAWTRGVVLVDRADQIALAAFSAFFLFQSLLFPLAAPDPIVANRLRWIFWLEAAAVLVVGSAVASGVPTYYGGAGMLAGATFVMGIVIFVLLLSVTRSTTGALAGKTNKASPSATRNGT